jgi:hypothetical protein
MFILLIYRLTKPDTVGKVEIYTLATVIRELEATLYKLTGLTKLAEKKEFLLSNPLEFILVLELPEVCSQKIKRV